MDKNEKENALSTIVNGLRDVLTSMQNVMYDLDYALQEDDNRDNIIPLGATVANELGELTKRVETYLVDLSNSPDEEAEKKIKSKFKRGDVLRIKGDMIDTSPTSPTTFKRNGMLVKSSYTIKNIITDEKSGFHFYFFEGDAEPLILNAAIVENDFEPMPKEEPNE